MKIRLLDRIETGHTVFPEIEGEDVAEQPGLRFLSVVERTLGGVKARVLTMLGDKGADVEVPKRLGERLVKTGHAEAK